MWQNPTFLLCVCCVRKLLQAIFTAFYLRLSQHDRDAGIQGRIAPLAVEASITCKTRQLLKALSSQLRLRLTRFLDLWSMAGSAFVWHQALWVKRGLSTKSPKAEEDDVAGFFCVKKIFSQLVIFHVGTTNIHTEISIFLTFCSNSGCWLSFVPKYWSFQRNDHSGFHRALLLFSICWGHGKPWGFLAVLADLSTASPFLYVSACL